MSDSDSSTSLPVVPAARHVPDYNNELDILVEETKHTQSRQPFFQEPDRTYRRQIRMAAATGNWVMASTYDKTHPNWVCTPLTVAGDTALHIAVRMEKTSFVDKLVERTSKLDTEIRKTNGDTAFCIAAISGNVKIARILFRKNPGLVWISGHEEKLPIQLASSAGHLRMVEFLFQRTQEDKHNKLPFQDIVKLFFLTLTSNIYIVSQRLLKGNPELTHTKNEDGLTALQLLSQAPFDKHAPGYRDLLSLLFKIMEEGEDEFLQSIETSKAMFDAAKSGNVIILEFIFNYNPSLFMKVNCQGQNLLHIAVLNRQGSVYRLILKKGSYKNVLVQCVDHERNNVLHLAGKLTAEGRFGSPIHQSLICSEELWFKELEKIVPPTFKTMKNREGLTPKELFYREHKRPSEKAIVELNEIANNFIVVATLLITLGITGALTIRTNTITAKTLIFQQKTWYKLFIISVGLGVSLCATSMLLFTSVILPSTWRKKGGYVYSRLTRMTAGYLFLYASILVLIIVSISSGAMLIYSFLPKWVFYAIGVLIAFPVASYFLFFYYSLYISLRLMLAFCQQHAAIILSKIGIDYNCDPFYLD